MTDVRGGGDKKSKLNHGRRSLVLEAGSNFRVASSLSAQRLKQMFEEYHVHLGSFGKPLLRGYVADGNGDAEYDSIQTTTVASQNLLIPCIDVQTDEMAFSPVKADQLAHKKYFEYLLSKKV
ncbi:hypothetical protein SELMODRAFT_410094 [Selaginella moellendorffii]|uniref:Uncharacterized protein n=1 Tax=Selaginella moellendorffii TaxID=88036 RepID=D8RDG2_SELML|nr:hypothetical protein SELMODRAFT_410094 [Selaginella moellendorffii]